jgi:hypothetical protein
MKEETVTHRSTGPRHFAVMLVRNTVEEDNIKMDLPEMLGSNEVVMHGELEKTWKAVVVACFDTVPQHSHGMTEKHKNPGVSAI